MKPAFAVLGLGLDQFVVENISLPEELQKVFDQRIGMNMVGDLGRYTLYAAASPWTFRLPTPVVRRYGMDWARAPPSRRFFQIPPVRVSRSDAAPRPGSCRSIFRLPGSKFCIECGHALPLSAKFCAECGKPQ